MILTEKNINQHKIENLIGKPNKFGFRKPKTIGNGSYFLKSFINKTDNSEIIKIDSKSNFEKYSNGILLRLNFSNELSAIPLTKNEINRIELIRGEERINPFPFSPMWILLKLGVSILTARYFKIYISEYSIKNMRLIIDTEKYEMEFIANGFLFERQLEYFENLNYGTRLKK
ncbi:hypothetical protein [uncultured Lutibacter sp.]|uniref:hypothetical protein n=1 Tax=uncultured Lutibacter sp. TaxID=437739 RepID=UPI002635D386|nr:hypothetical protein [uncultured Lutibacter sp.]